MDAHVKEIVRELTRASDEERIVFPDVVRTMIENGVERYHTDLVLGTHTYFMPDGGHEATQGYAPETPVPAELSAAAMAAALRAVQHGETTYRSFCDQIAAAGCVGYFVSVAGKRVLYYGRNGDTYAEWFPGAKP